MVEEVIIKPLSAVDAQEIIKMDDMSGFYVSQWLEEMDEDNDYSWGIYVDHVLAGYCTIGYADDVPSVIEKHPDYSSESYLLSDVFIKPEYRHNGYGLQMITETILGRWRMEETGPVFLEILYDKLKNFYGKARFELLSDGVCMVLLPENIKRTKMDLSKDEKNDINARLTEIQTILESALYEDRIEEQELIKERKELEHLLEVS